MNKEVWLSAIVIVLVALSTQCFCQGRSEMNLGDRSILTETMVEMSWVEIKKEAEKEALVLLPISVVEEHGPHLDISPDIYLTTIHCRIMKHHLDEAGLRTIIAPPYYWGINGTKSFPGSFTTSPETFRAMLHDIVASLKSWGFKKVIYVNLHGDGDHRRAISASAAELRKALKVEVYDLSALEVNVLEPSLPPRREGKFRPDYHAGANETADIYEFFPDKVRMDIVKALKPQSNFEPMGYVGDPANFQWENGAQVFKLFAKHDAERVVAFMRDKTHQGM